MEKRALIAIVLSVAILLAWQFLFVPPTPPPPAPGAKQTPAGNGSPEGTAGDGAARGTTAAPVVAPRPALPAPAAGGGRSLEVRTPLYQVTFGPDGSATAWTLFYRGTKQLLVGPGIGPLAVAVSREGKTEVVALRPEADRLELTPERPKGDAVFTGAAADGLRLEKRLRFDATTYRIEAELRAEGGSGAEPATLLLYWTSPVGVPGKAPSDPWLTFGEGTDHRHLLGRILVARNGKPDSYDAPPPALKDPKDSPRGPELRDTHPLAIEVLPTPHRWVALENDYFIAAFFPPNTARVLRGRDRELSEVGVVFAEVRPAPGRAWEGKTDLYVGPKEWDRLAALNVGLEQAQARNYGEFLWTLPMEWFCVPLLWLMNFFASRLPGQNYGVAIILLTVLVKAAFYPLTQKSMSSMKQMQALQPQLTALKAKYKSDPQRFQREQMELFRKHRVNPMGGCLPMVVQIPIFYALYLTLQYSVELQGAPFMLWISDLSKKDPYYVLPVLMGVSMLVQQKMTPTVGDPRQAQIMLIMPVIFTFMFIEFPTGLVLYWLVNNCLSIAQQYLIDRAARRKAGTPVEAKAEKEARKA
jgi:YidC/Oxa1 family membrane protein insertase